MLSGYALIAFCILWTFHSHFAKSETGNDLVTLLVLNTILNAKNIKNVLSLTFCIKTTLLCETARNTICEKPVSQTT